MNTQVKTLKHKLAVLLGQVPAKTDYPRVRKFPDLSEFPRTGIPGESVNRRPDVKSTFYQVQAADQKVASAIAKQYPRLNLTGSISSSGADAGTLFQNWLASLAADLTVPAFDAGQRQAEVRRTEAVLSRRLNDYKQTVLTAFREVEDALVREKHQRKQVKKIKQQFQTAKKTVEILRNRYANGATDFLSVLDAIQTKQQLQRDLATARRKIVIDRIGLYRALSGGWPMSREQTTTDNTEQEGV